MPYAGTVGTKAIIFFKKMIKKHEKLMMKENVFSST
jgi:hypothetical protein